MSITSSKIRFQKINATTIVLLFVLILAGGVVRSTGSGMGCPDWPKCFGQYVPPTNSSELPADYKKKYVSIRLAKNQRFAKMLDFFGNEQFARRIREDKSILIPEEFNAFKTWTEYINRLIGAISGLFLLLTAIYSFSYKLENKWITILSITNVVIVMVQAWLGAIVVSTNLVPIIVTVHMLLAIAILAISIGTYFIAKTLGKQTGTKNTAAFSVSLFVLLTSIVQIVFGTEVREKIDAVSARLQGSYRDDWVNSIGAIFEDHRSTSIVILITNVALFLIVRKHFNKHSMQQQLMSFTVLIIMLQIVTGIVLSYWSLPPIAQAVHILLSTVLFGTQFYLMLNIYKPIYLQGGNK
jgi:cytochrome c oxidase assembly protein subunit 15